jgi:coatomer protein complex subunit gamma
MCEIESLSAIQLAPAISVLQDLLSSPSPIQRFAAVKTLSQVVQRFPLIVTPCSVELERLITDNNRSIGTLAISTLLKTGAEANVDRLMKSISGFMSEISDEFRIVVRVCTCVCVCLCVCVWVRTPLAEKHTH